MYAFLISLIAVLALLLCVIILMQAGKGGGLAAAFGGAATSSSTDSFMGGRQAATLLTKLTWIGGGIFLFLGLVISIMSTESPEQRDSILRGEFQGGAVPEAPASVLEAEAASEREAPSPLTAPEEGESSGTEGLPQPQP